ncbi:MAG: alpha/beta-type small acid-soluble spore protein [Clostridia bacterium]|nr:alpha/beta-type small acid-soluble spore protein [Clostridia bacterium]MDD4146809.1 alpha/beta-type small acid-soluble spore protein [Clostridia bacterium]MDD4665735.1 alpha/beta-type small acid-soluble spore protein [Clostridia bacterium]
MAKRRRIMSDALKMECAKELGFFDQIQRDGDFGNVSSRHCGSMVRKAIEIAERSVAANTGLPQG